MKAQMVAPDFIVPERLESGRFVLRPITIHDVVKDYDAVMTSVDHIAGVFGPDTHWPAPELTLEQDLIDLAWHQKEFQIRSSFTYTVVTPDESAVLGCVYLLPSLKGIQIAKLSWGPAEKKSSRAEPPTIPVGLDAYRQWDRWPVQRIGQRAYMRSTYDRDKVQAALAEALAEDPVPTQLYGFTRLGHFELTRARRGATLAAQLEALERPGD